MAALYGRMHGNRGEVTRTGSGTSGIESKLETWDGSIQTVLEADGSFQVYVGSKHNANTLIAKGNINDGSREVMVPDYRANGDAAHYRSTLYEAR